MVSFVVFFFSCYGDHRDLHVLTTSFPTRRASDLEYSAGRLMQRELVAIPAYWTVGETIDFMRASPDLPEDFYDLFVVDPRHRPVGTVSLSRVLRNRSEEHTSELQSLMRISYAVFCLKKKKTQ